MYTHVYNFDDDRFCNNFINFLTKQDVPMIVQGSNHYDACQVNDAYVQVLILIQCRYVLSPCMDINRAPNVFLWRNYKICLVNLRKYCLLCFRLSPSLYSVSTTEIGQCQCCICLIRDFCWSPTRTFCLTMQV